MLWILLGCLAIVAASELYKRRNLSDLPEISDEEFLRMYNRRFITPDVMVFEGRKLVAEHLGIPYQKLSPDQNFQRISRYTGFVTEYELGMSDLEDKLFDLCERVNISPPRPFPETVGEFINEMARAKEKLPEDAL